VSENTDKSLRFLKAYAFVATTAILILAIVAYLQMRRTHFTEIDVQRINVVEPNGTLRLAITNHARMPDPVIEGKSYPLRTGTGGAGAGLIFFNDEGNENGGLTYTGRKTPNGYTAGAGLTFDQYNQDETVTLSYDDEDGERAAGLNIVDRPAISIKPFAESAMVFHALPDGPDKTKRLQEFKARAAKEGNYGGATRFYAGKGGNKESLVRLSDPKGRARIRMMVDSTGAPSLEFLDSTGHVTYHLPAAQK
jgi:hypothetical protein